MAINDSTQHAGYCMCMECQKLKVRLEERKRWEDALKWANGQFPFDNEEVSLSEVMSVTIDLIREAYREQRKPEE